MFNNNRSRFVTHGRRKSPTPTKGDTFKLVILILAKDTFYMYFLKNNNTIKCK